MRRPFPPMLNGIRNKTTFCMGCLLPVSTRENLRLMALPATRSPTSSGPCIRTAEAAALTFHASVSAVYAKPRLSRLLNTAVGVSAVRQWICPLSTLSGLLLTALMLLYCACNVRETFRLQLTQLRSSTSFFNVTEISAAFAFLKLLVRARAQAGHQAA
jgi:hypothetical protein